MGHIAFSYSSTPPNRSPHRRQEKKGNNTPGLGLYKNNTIEGQPCRLYSVCNPIVRHNNKINSEKKKGPYQGGWWKKMGEKKGSVIKKTGLGSYSEQQQDPLCPHTLIHCLCNAGGLSRPPTRPYHGARKQTSNVVCSIFSSANALLHSNLCADEYTVSWQNMSEKTDFIRTEQL